MTVDEHVGKIIEVLDRDGALDLGGSPWPSIGEDEDIFEVDWKKLFPKISREPWARGHSRRPRPGPLRSPGSARRYLVSPQG